MLDNQKELIQNTYSKSVTSFWTAAFSSYLCMPNTLCLKETGTRYWGAQLQWVRRHGLWRHLPLLVDCTGDAYPYVGDIEVSKGGGWMCHQSDLLQPMFTQKVSGFGLGFFQHHPWFFFCCYFKFFIFIQITVKSHHQHNFNIFPYIPVWYSLFHNRN